MVIDKNILLGNIYMTNVFKCKNLYKWPVEELNSYYFYHATGKNDKGRLFSKRRKSTQN